MATAGEPSTEKNSSSLTNSDLVSRFMTTNPSYSYNVPPIQHDFFFSEMLRSFVQAKNEGIPFHHMGSRRRKRHWKETRDRPLELTKKEKVHNRNIPHTSTSTVTSSYSRHYYQHQSNQSPELALHQQCASSKEHPPPNSVTEAKNKCDNCYSNDSSELIFKIPKLNSNNLKSISATEHEKKDPKNNFIEKVCFNSTNEIIFPKRFDNLKTNGLENSAYNSNNNLLQYCTSPPVNSLFPDHKNKLEIAQQNLFPNISSRSEEFQSISNFRIPSSKASEFISTPLWYPPYALSQNYPLVDPLHFFIDLRVSGHVLDRKYNDKYIFNRNKHHSAFTVPQAKEYNSPLNLTRSGSTVSCSTKNSKGTHYIFRNIKEMYNKIWGSKNLLKNDVLNNEFYETITPLNTQIISNKGDETNTRKVNPEHAHFDMFVNN